ncbi:D-serine ammonia-lyase [Nitrincola sp.]|uniref:D-serine ammonia-lyase n=1 Tax=Nitrincola sp. TaxID=1926584 RepID=UPI003A8DCFC3
MNRLTLSDWLGVAQTGQDPMINDLMQARETLWINPGRVPFEQVRDQLPLKLDDIEEAAARLQRFAAYLAQMFPETAEQGGIIESPLLVADKAPQALAEWLTADVPGKLLIKCDSHLAISGSIKARGGIYEILLYAEKLALEQGLLPPGCDDYACFASEPFRALFAQHTVVVGSTGNLGLSIGIISAQLGFQVIVHMSADARAWKKALLRQKGVQVIEHSSDYSVAVAQGRAEALRLARCHFVDDEDSTALFLGYAVAALRLKQQLLQEAIRVDAQHPLIVYLPCGVGGGPGGIAFGLKQVFGDLVHCFFAEPTHSPCMLLGMYTGLHQGISVQDIGLDNLTCADGLAVGRASVFVGKMMEPLLDGIYTVADEQLYALVALIHDSEGLDLEPSAVAGMPGFAKLFTAAAAGIATADLPAYLDQATHVVWATGGKMVPALEMQGYYCQGKAVMSG